MNAETYNRFHGEGEAVIGVKKTASYAIIRPVGCGFAATIGDPSDYPDREFIDHVKESKQSAIDFCNTYVDEETGEPLAISE